MGAVYRAEHLGLGRHVALKILRRELTSNPEIVQRFDREVRATAAIDHPHVVTVFDMGILADSSLYYTMELVEGQTLGAVLRRERILPWARLRGIALQICSALAAAHARGIVHRDLKPGNILLTERDGTSDFVKVIDFGIAKVLREHGSQGLTSTGVILGTPMYMAPEQTRGSGDQRIDIYSLGVILYQCLSGQRPFSGQSDLEVLASILTTTPPPLSELVEGLPAVLAEVVARAMASDPANRPGTMQALADELRACGESAVEDAPERTTVAYVKESPHAVIDIPVTPVRGTVPLVNPSRLGPVEQKNPGHVELGEFRGPKEPARTSRTTIVLLSGLLVLSMASLLAWSLLRGSERKEVDPSTVAALPKSVLAEPIPNAPKVDERSAVDNSLSPAKDDGETAERPIPSPPSVEAPQIVTTPMPVTEAKRPLTLDQALIFFEKRAGTQCRSDLESRIRVELVIEASGRLLERRVLPPHEMTSTAGCILGLLDSQRFPVTKGGLIKRIVTVLPRPKSP